MALDAEACYQALRARDPRFDGVFYVGVATTGIYCRPVCPARTPGRDRCSFYDRAAEAERAGFRACFRCRPELAPGAARVDSVPSLARRAASKIEAGYLDTQSITSLADTLGVSARHLRRAMEAELGVSPVELAQTQRLALAKQLLQDTDLPIATLAHAAGFGSVRRFNAVFRRRFDRAPSSVRRGTSPPNDEHGITVRLAARAPFDAMPILAFVAARAIPGVERVDGQEYRRVTAAGDNVGWMSVRPRADAPGVTVSLSLSLAPSLPQVIARVRSLFDLDARPELIDRHLEADPRLRARVRQRPGLRVPGAYDGFELAMRAVLGQQVSVAAATTMSGRLAARFGDAQPQLGPTAVRFPSAARLARATQSEVASIGLPTRRAQTLLAVAKAVHEGTLELSPAAELEPTLETLLALPGIGPWTAHYIAMRALEWPDALPASDLVLRRALEVSTARQVERCAAPWSPWRAYACMQLWAGPTEQE
ncbi:MAG: AlkA N-terminal domain-containing protein [Myxococcota bacterium]